MTPASEHHFPLFPLPIVALPSELVPLRIFEERYKAMIAHCEEHESEFGILWLSADGLRTVGCACEIAEVLERREDGQVELLARGTRPFELLERQPDRPYPAGIVAWLGDRDEPADAAAGDAAREAYTELVEQATDQEPDADELASMDAFAMAATVDFGADAKQGLLDLRSENARLRLVCRLFRAALKRLEFVERAQARARSNGKVRFA